MRTIVVDDEPIMIKSFLRLCKDIEVFGDISTFQFPEDALEYAQNNKIDIAILDIKMPRMTGIELAKELRKKRRDILIVFVTAYDDYIRESNQINADGYIMKPYSRNTIEQLGERLKLLSKRQEKDIYVQMFGCFTVLKNGQPVPITGKAKEILALVASKCGKEISNEEIYSTIWENRSYSNVQMKVYYNALKRLKDVLELYGIGDLLISTARGQILNTEIVDCDYYSWKKNGTSLRDSFEGEFLSEYSWGEYILADILNNMDK